jgi:hypothetical protein
VPRLRCSEVSRRQAVSGAVAQTKGTGQRTVLKLFHYSRLVVFNGNMPLSAIFAVETVMAVFVSLSKPLSHVMYSSLRLNFTLIRLNNVESR